MIPTFAVVGHPNKGKSSIVATLAQDDSVYIDHVSGTTTKATAYPMAINGQILYELIDTPGFQRAHSALSWLKRHCSDVSQRNQAVEEFCHQHRHNNNFVSEYELLQPIVNGAGIIYVVDGSCPYGPEYEAEMEILRWTGQPSLAIINPIEGEDYVREWENALGQYFKTVRVFDAHRAEFLKRTTLLEVFGHLRPEWEKPIAHAVDAISSERKRQHHQAGEFIATLLVDSLQYRESQRIPGDVVPNGIKSLLSKKFKLALRQLENRCRRQVEETYAYYKLQRAEPTFDVDESDLFDQERWYLFGLNRKQLIAVAAGSGAGAGFVIDAGLGGHSLLLGSVLGGLGGGIGAFAFSKQIAKLSLKGLPTGGSIVHYGPISNPNFPFVLLGRALHHLQSICTRTHANRTQLTLEENPPMESFNLKDKSQLMSLFKDIGNDKRVFQQREKLIEIIEGYANSLDYDV